MIIRHADDYGISLNASKDILSLIQQKKLSGISVIPNMSCFSESIELLLPVMKNNTDLSVALHLNFFEGHCCADSSQLSLLADANGYFTCSWMQLLKHSFSSMRNTLRSQLSLEIHAQIRKLLDAMPSDYRLCIDSHQHSHMIPVVWDALRDTILCHHYKVQYIRISREPLLPYLSCPSLYCTYPPVNIVKNIILQLCTLHTRRNPITADQNSYYLWGLIMGGAMDEARIHKLMPKFQKYGQDPGTLELLFHPGIILKEELSPEYNNPDFVAAETSAKRKKEYESLMKL